MKATTIAATAAILGSVSADGWEGWSSSADAITTSADPTWTEWSTTAKTPDPTTEEAQTWTEWTTSTPVADPATWSEWESSSTTKSKPDPATETSVWNDWEGPKATTTTTKKSDPETWSEWSSSTTSSKPKPATSTDPAWGEWEDPSKATTTPAAVTSAWGEWDDGSKVTVKSTSTQWITVTVYKNNGGETWSEWSAPATKTATDSKTVVVSSTVTKTASASGWSSWAEPSFKVDPGCKLQVSLSYGLPIWFPTASVNWDDWKSTTTSSKPAVNTKTASTSWGEWESSSTSSKPKAVTSTASWGEWDSSKTSSKPVVATSTATWGEWDASKTSSKPVVATSASSWAAWEGDNKAIETPKSSKTTGAAGAAQTWSSWSQDNHGISANGNKFGMTYSPYTASSGCKDQSVVAADIASMAAKGFTSVRVYSTDCYTLEYVGAACREHGMKIILGVFISETGISGAQPQVDAIAKWAQWDLVELIVVGNEAVFSGRCSAADLAGFIASSKQTFKSAGFTGAVSTTDELSVWQSQGSAWCDVVDVVTANLYAFFNPNTAAQDAGSFIQAQIGELSAICPGKEVYVMESGWPSAGECNGAACPSPENQAIAIKGIQAAVGAKVVFFSYEDEQWKTPGQFGVEQHWGCGEVFQ